MRSALVIIWLVPSGLHALPQLGSPLRSLARPEPSRLRLCRLKGHHRNPPQNLPRTSLQRQSCPTWLIMVQRPLTLASFGELDATLPRCHAATLPPSPHLASFHPARLWQGSCVAKNAPFRPWLQKIDQARKRGCAVTSQLPQLRDALQHLHKHVPVTPRSFHDSPAKKSSHTCPLPKRAGAAPLPPA